jgi:hypothetical protein
MTDEFEGFTQSPHYPSNSTPLSIQPAFIKGPMRTNYLVTILLSLCLWHIRSIASRARAGWATELRRLLVLCSQLKPHPHRRRREAPHLDAGIEYSHRLWGNDSLRLDYEGSISPFFQERDPTVVATYPTVSTVGLTSYVEALPSIGERVVYATNNPVGYVGRGDGSMVYVYAIYGSTKTYAPAISPLGARVSGLSSHHLQPTFSADLGMVFSSRDLPVDGTASSNFLFSLGHGMQFI